MFKMLIACMLLLAPAAICLHLGYTMMVVLWGFILCLAILMFAPAWKFIVGLEFWIFASAELLNYKSIVPSYTFTYNEQLITLYPEYAFYTILCIMVYDSAKKHGKIRGV